MIFLFCFFIRSWSHLLIDIVLFPENTKCDLQMSQVTWIVRPQEAIPPIRLNLHILIPAANDYSHTRAEFTMWMWIDFWSFLQFHHCFHECKLLKSGCWKNKNFGEMNHTKNMIVVDNLFITCCFLIVASSKCKSLSLVLVYVVSVIPILYCSYWHCTFVSDTMHMTYTGLFSHANGPNLIKQHFYLTADLIARLDTFLPRPAHTHWKGQRR